MKNDTKMKRNKISKAYLNQLQNQIDSLEQQLFSFNNFNNNKINNDNPKGKLILNKNLDEPLNQNKKEYSIKNSSDDNFNNSNFENDPEKDELYNIILRERKEYNELDEVRKIQNEKFKQSQNKCKALERNNLNLRNDMEILQREKIEQQKKIIELQN
jgi:hypothetical protein